MINQMGVIMMGREATTNDGDDNREDDNYMDQSIERSNGIDWNDRTNIDV